MSVVAVKMYEDKVVIAADSIVVRYDFTKRTDRFSKLIEIHDMIIGGCGSAEELSLMFRYAQTHKPDSASEKDVLAFMCTFSKWKNDMTGSSTIENQYIIVYKGCAFEATRMFINEIKNYAAIGAGEDFATVALYLGHDPAQAVKVACDLCCFVAEPIVQYEMKRENE